MVGANQGFHVGPSPYLEAERAALEEEKAKHVEMQQLEADRIRRTVEDQLRAELDEMLAAHASGGWKAIFCCCFPRKEVCRRPLVMAWGSCDAGS